MKKEKDNLCRATIFAAVLAAAALVCFGCGKGETPEGENPVREETADTETETEAAKETAEDTKELPEEMSAETGGEIREQFTDDEGRILLTSTFNSVSVRFPGNQEAEKAVNSFFADLSSAYEDTVEEYCDMAREDLTWREEEGLAENWNGYGLGRTYSVIRADEKALSVLESGYEDTGGAHPNSSLVAYNFDTATGKRLALADITDDLDGLRKESLEYLKGMLAESEFADLLFDDYENSIEDVLTDATWYPGEDGFHIICNEYIVTPHAAGILDFAVPYEKMTTMSEKYIPEQTGEKETAEHEAGERPASGTMNDRSE